MFHQLLRRRTRGAILRLTVTGDRVAQHDRVTGRDRYVPGYGAVVVSASIQFRDEAGRLTAPVPVTELVGVKVWGRADDDTPHVRSIVIKAARRAGILATKTGLLNDSLWQFSWR